jgi:hypothetical protein
LVLPIGLKASAKIPLHYFVVLNRNPQTEEILILAIASSQVEKRKEIIIKLGFPVETLVKISPTEYTQFTKETVIDCNRAFEKSIQSLKDKLEAGRLKVCVEIMPEEIVTKIVQGMLVSTQISRNIQDIIR